MASEHEQYPGLEHIREGATAETQHLLTIIDEMEKKRWRVNDELIKAVDAYIEEEAKRKAAEQQLAQARNDVAYWKRAYEERLDGLITANANIKKAFTATEAQNAAMRALLEPLTETDPSGYGAESSTRYCPYCDASEEMDDVPVEHTADCAWRKARALRHAQHKEPE